MERMGTFFNQNFCKSYSHEWSISTRVPDKNMFIWFRGLGSDAKLWDELYCYTLRPNDAYIYTLCVSVNNDAYMFMYILCVSVNKTIIGSDNGLSPVLHQDVIRNNAGLLWIGLSGTHFSRIIIKIHRNAVENGTFNHVVSGQCVKISATQRYFSNLVMRPSGKFTWFCSGWELVLRRTIIELACVERGKSVLQNQG